MSSTNKTTNYNLSQFIGSDKPAWLVDYNGDMSAIDTQMKANADAADAAQTTANTADSKADTNASAISTLDSQINGASGVAADVTSLQGSVNTINSLIGSGEPTTSQKTLIGAINELDAENGDISQLETTNKSSLVAAINEVNEKGWSFAIVNITADGVKTISALLDELHAAVVSKYAELNAKYFYPISVFGSAIGIGCTAESWFVRNAINSPIIFTADYVESASLANGVVHHQYDVKTSGSVAISGNSATGTYTNDSSSVPTSGQTIGLEFMYRLD